MLADATLMQPGKAESRRKLILWGGGIAAANFVAVVWHVTLLVKLRPSFPTSAIVLLLLVNLLPVAGVLAFAKEFGKSAALMMILPLAIALVIGGYSHFLSPGSDNVLRMPPGELTLPCQASAVLLESLEAMGCWVAVRIFRYR